MRRDATTWEMPRTKPVETKTCKSDSNPPLVETNVEQEIATLFEYWKGRLRLRDWDISVSIVYDLDGKTGRSITMPYGRYKCAAIKILHPKAVSIDCLGNTDAEVTLVHELLHLQASGFDPKLRDKRSAWEAYETFIELTALALVAERRKAEAPVA